MKYETAFFSKALLSSSPGSICAELGEDGGKEEAEEDEDEDENGDCKLSDFNSAVGVELTEAWFKDEIGFELFGFVFDLGLGLGLELGLELGLKLGLELALAFKFDGFAFKAGLGFGLLEFG